MPHQCSPHRCHVAASQPDSITWVATHIPRMADHLDGQLNMHSVMQPTSVLGNTSLKTIRVEDRLRFPTKHLRQATYLRLAVASMPASPPPAC